MINLTIYHYQNMGGTWDSQVEDAPHIQVKDAESLEQAKVFIRLLIKEEASSMNIATTHYIIEREIINYWVGE